MKNIIILGAPRVGKSTLSSLICSKFNNVHYVGGDSIRNAFMKIYPELNYTPKNTIEKIDFCEFINDIVTKNRIHLKRDIYHVIDSTDISVENAINVFKDDKIIIALGVTDISKEELKDNIKKFDTQYEWTYKYTDEELLEVSKKTINKSICLKRKCEEYSIPYFETSGDRKRVLDEIIEYITKVFEEYKI